jgi:inner membrane protein
LVPSLWGRAQSWARSPWAPAVALCGVGFLDLVGSFGDWPVPVEGVRDAVAHLLTAWLFLAALPAVVPRFAVWVLVGAVVIDLDHIPLYVWHVGAVTQNGRPVSHSLVTILVLLALAGLDRRLRTPLLGLALGVALHFVRDVATGPGLPSAWPLSAANVRVPYPVYVAAVTGLAVAATWPRRRLVSSADERQAGPPTPVEP